jgi:hypothetical protein
MLSRANPSKLPPSVHRSFMKDAHDNGFNSSLTTDGNVFLGATVNKRKDVVTNSNRKFYNIIEN